MATNAVVGQLDVDVVRRAVEQVEAATDIATEGRPERIANLELALAKSEATRKKLARAIGLLDDGKALDALLAELKSEQANGRRIKEELEAARHAPGAAEVTAILLRQAVDLYDLLLTQEVAKSRSVLRRLGVRLTVGRPSGKRGSRSFPLTLTGSYAGLLGKGIQRVLAVGPEAGVTWIVGPENDTRPNRPIAGGSDGEDVPTEPLGGGRRGPSDRQEPVGVTARRACTHCRALDGPLRAPAPPAQFFPGGSSKGGVAPL